MRFKTKQKGLLKADEIHQAEQILFRFVQTESFPIVSKSIANSNEISKTLNIAKLSPFIQEDRTIRVKGRLKHSNLDYNAKDPILLTVKHPVVQLLLEKAHRDNLHEGTEYVRNMPQKGHRICEKHAMWETCFKNQVELYQTQTQKCQPNSPTDGRSTQRMAWWTCVQIHPYRSWLLRTHRSEVPTTYLEEIVLPLYLRDNESRTHRSHTVIGHRVMSSCCDKIHCKTWLPKYHHQRQRNKFRWSSQRVESFHERVGQR